MLGGLWKSTVFYQTVYSLVVIREYTNLNYFR